jgi:hypothetical protein
MFTRTHVSHSCMLDLTTTGHKISLTLFQFCLLLALCLQIDLLIICCLRCPELSSEYRRPEGRHRHCPIQLSRCGRCSVAPPPALVTPSSFASSPVQNGPLTVQSKMVNKSISSRRPRMKLTNFNFGAACKIGGLKSCLTLQRASHFRGP